MMKRNKNRIAGTIAAVIALTALGLSGCASTSGVEATGKMAWDEQGARTLDKNVVFNNNVLKRAIQIVDIKSSMAGDIMRAQATLRSNDRDTVPFQYRFEWYDAGGFEINSGAGSWKPLLLNGRESKTVQAVAPDPRAKEFKLKIREPD